MYTFGMHPIIRSLADIPARFSTVPENMFQRSRTFYTPGEFWNQDILCFLGYYSFWSYLHFYNTCLHDPPCIFNTIIATGYHLNQNDIIMDLFFESLLEPHLGKAITKKY